MKKLQVINDLEQQVTAARSATDTSRQQVAAAADRRRELLLAALEAHFRLEGLRREVGTARAVQVALVSELQSLGTVTAQGERVSQEHHAHAHAQVQGHRHGNQLTMTAPGAAAVTAVAEPWGRSSVSGGHASGVDAAEAAMVDGDVLVVEDCGLPAAVGTGDVCTPSLPEAIQPAGSGRQLGVSAAGTLASTATTLSTAVVGASVAGTAVVPDVLFSDGNAPPPSPASAGPHLASVAQQPPSSTGRSETAVTSAPRLVPGLATTCGAGALTRRPESSLPQTRDVNVCTGNPGSTIAPGCSAAGGEGGGGGGGTHLLIGTGICTGVKKELQEQQQQQQQRHLAATAVVAAPGLQPLIPGGYFRGAHPHPSNGMATLPSASRPAHAAAAAATGTSNAADAPAVSSTGVMQVLPHLPTGLSTGPSVSASFAMAFTSPPNSAVQPPMPVPLPYGAAAVDAPPPSHLLFEPPQVPLLLQGGPQGFLHHPPPPPHGARVPSRPIHRRHFSAGCAIELSGRPPVHVCRGGEPSCAGEVLLSTAPSFAPVASLPSAAPFPVVVPACHSRTRSTTTLTAAASSIITSINPAHKTTPTIPISTSASAIAADTDVVSGGDTDAADALQLRMRLSASSSHGPALPVFAAPASGAGPGPCYRPRSSNAGLVGAYEVPTTLAPTAVADGSGSGSGMEIEGRGQGGPGSPMALDQMGPDSLMPDLPSVEDFLLKEAEGTGVGSTEAEGGMA
ncbi:hypothetical protein VaNZ11_010874 [Volvox africanus]|uniref:Uncharacterized protein n=1 Tax=Volvox africanus TaxID=51714 RepID=A0ABQ5SC13_9CHLO|nr:hypothetical protein VaNZ11_010874 [Volvox africanus]